MKKKIIAAIIAVCMWGITWGSIFLPNRLIYVSKGTDSVYTKLFDVWSQVGAAFGMLMTIVLYYLVAHLLLRLKSK